MNNVEQFLSAVLPSQGFRFIFCVMPDGKTPQKDFDPTELTSMLGFASWAVSKRADAYFAVGAYTPGPDGSLKRVATQAYLHRCLRLDLDVGAEKAAAGKGYATKADAVKALGGFCHTFAMPQPWIVDSGYGIHVYWAFDRDLPLRDWLGLADRLRTAAAQQGLIVDPTTTIDAARVLRLPGTFNFKHGAQAPVRILGAGIAVDPATIAHVLPIATGVVPGAPAPVQISGMVPSILAGQMGTSELQANQFPPYFVRNMLAGCPGMAAMFADQGARASEPLWKLALDLINKADDDDSVKIKVARHLSQGHPGFSEGVFLTKWGQVRHQNYHPPTCKRMSDMGMPECARCPLRGSIKSPVALGRPQPQQIAPPNIQAAIPMPPAAAPPPPPGNFTTLTPMSATQLGVFLLTGQSAVPIVDGNLTRDLAVRDGLPSTRVEVKQKNADGSDGVREWWAPLLPYRMLEAERLLDAVGKQQLTVITFDRHSDGTAKVEFSTKALAEPQTFMSTLCAHGIHVTRKQAANLQDVFMPEFLSQLQRARAANQIASRCGWTDDKSGFVLGTRLFQRGSIQHVRPSNAPEEMEAYHAAGEDTAWRNAFDITLAGGPDRQAVLALAIAAPLMAFTGLDGVMLNAYSPESGVGKSTLCDAALSIWGAPEKLRKDFRDTANATFKLASVVGNLPMVVDEFTNVEGKALSDYIYTITQGREKHRLGADSRLNTSGPRWCLPTIVTSNNSIHDKLQAYRGDAVAEAARVFELRLRPLVIDMAQLGAIKSALLGLRSNYGFLGPKIVELLLARDPEHWRVMVAERIAWWDKEVSQDASDRFRAACCALIDIGCAIGAAMGYNFDRNAVIETVRMQWNDQQRDFDAQRKAPLDYVSGFIVEHLSDFAIFGGADAQSMVAQAPRRFFGEIRGRSVAGKYTASGLIIPLDLFREYVREKNGNFKAISEWMRDELRTGGVVSRMGKLVFLEGQMQQVQTHAVEFKAAVLGGAPLRLAALDGVEVPTIMKDAK